MRRRFVGSSPVSRVALILAILVLLVSTGPTLDAFAQDASLTVERNAQGSCSFSVTAAGDGRMVIVARGGGQVVSRAVDLTRYAHGIAVINFFVRPATYEVRGLLYPVAGGPPHVLTADDAIVRRSCSARRRCPRYLTFIPTGAIRVKALSCRGARELIDAWVNIWRFTGRRPPHRTRIGAYNDFRCTYRQTKPGRDFNPYAVVRCRAHHGRRLYFEGYA